jgi:hypothetical protein
LNETAGPSEPRGAAPFLSQTRFRIGALVVIAAVIGVVVWLAVGNGNDSSPSREANAVAISPSGLSTLAGALKQSIYWVGPASDVKYEITRPASGRILLGYLPSNLDVGDRTPHLTVGTYPITNAYAVTQRAARQPDTVKINVGGGAVAFYNKKFPLHAFISYPGSSYQIEVYDPSPRKARQLVRSGAVKPVPGSPPESTRAVAVSERALAKRAAQEHQPIYWAGPVKQDTYELTKTSRRWFFVRYLPPGVSVGSGKAYLTIGTYPVSDAYGAVQSLAREKGAESIDVAGGGLAVVNPSKYPKSIFVAFPGANYQVEVFDPSLAHARRLVTQGRITSAG